MVMVPELQFTIIVISAAALLVIAAAIIFYKLGKSSKALIDKNRALNEKKEIIPSTSQVKDALKVAEKKTENSKVSIIDSDKIMLYQQRKEKKINPSELYEKKIEEEINYKEKNNVKEDKKRDFKFLKYTSEGYKPAKEDKDPRNLGWR